MSYCPDCGKKAADPYAKFCGYCQASLTSLGTASSTPKPAVPVAVASPATFQPVVITPKSSAIKSRADLMREQRLKQLYPELVETQATADEFGEVNVQSFDPSTFTGLQIEIDNRPTQLGERMTFQLPLNS